MTEFTIWGPYVIPSTKNKGVKRITQEDIEDFWHENPDLLHQKGCYVFALQNKSMRPFYLGKATKGFQKEIFTAHKVEKYNDVLHSNTIGKPVMFLVNHPAQKGKVNVKAIDEIENYLIQSAIIVNPELKNIQKTKRPSWTIRNVIEKAPGKSKDCELQFARMMRLE